MSELRRLWVKLHRWLGLSLGVLGVFIGLSGAVLTYDHELDGWLNPQRYAVSGAEASQSFAAYAGRVREALPGARVLNIRMPEEEGMPVVALARPRESAQFYRIYLDPPTGNVLDTAAGGGLIGWLHRFHENLTLREYWGREIVGLVGFAMLFSALSGVYLWWPARGRFREALGLRAGFTASRNFHYIVGFYGALLLGALSFTGIWLAYTDAGRSVVSAFGPLSPSPRSIQRPQATEGGKVISPDEAAGAAKALYPQALVTLVAFPVGPRGAYRIAMREPRGSIGVFLDPASGAVLHRSDPGTRTAGDRFLALQRTLHTGEGFSGPLRALLFVGGLLPCVFAATGILMWQRQRRRKRALAPATLAEKPQTLA